MEEYLPNTNISSLLKDSARDTQYIQTYLNQPRIQNWLNIKAAPAAEDEQTCLSRPTYKKLSELIQQDKHFGRMAARQADLKDLKRLSGDFETCTNTKQQKQYLKLFSVMPYPGNIKHLISFLYSKDEQNVRYALSSLSQSMSPSIRLLLDNASDDFLKDKVCLFANNFISNDINRLNRLFKIQHDEHQIHNFVSDLVDIIEINGAKVFHKLLDEIFKVNNCGLCRESLIIASIKDACISKQILDSLPYDSDLDIRQLAKTTISS